MTLVELLGILCAILSGIISIIIALVSGWGWWAIVCGFGGLIIGWLIGVALALVLVQSEILTPPEYRKRKPNYRVTDDCERNKSSPQ